MSKQAPIRRTGRRPTAAWLLITGAVCGLLWAGVHLVSNRSAGPVERGRIAYDEGRMEDARRLAEQAMETQPRSSAARQLAAEVAVAQERYQDAVRLCGSIPVDDSRESIESEVLCGEVLLEHQRLIAPAEARFRRVLMRAPDHPVALDRLVYLLSLETRDRELAPFQLSLIRDGHVTPQRVFSLALGHRIYPDLELIDRFHEADPAACGPILALARIAVRENAPQRARDLLIEIVSVTPDVLEAQARLGELILAEHDDATLRTWLKSLPYFAMEHPVVCEVLGRVALMQGDDRGAARYFQEALRLDPNLQVSNYQLGQCLVRLGRSRDAAPFLERAELLERYTQLIDRRSQDVGHVVLDAGLCRRAAALCRDLGLVWEEFAWLTFTSENELLSARETDRIEQLSSSIRSLPLRRTGDGVFPAETLDFSDWPLPAWDEMLPPPVEETPSDATSGVRFTDMAEPSGIRFWFYSDANPSIHGMGRAFEFTGGGVAAVDFDCDGWTDIYLAQGARIPAVDAAAVYLDRLYRNTGADTFVDATEGALIREDRYSQGVAAGDVNDDGFPDLFVANLGANRLFLNNGDGTFSEMPQGIPQTQRNWTTSAAIVDLTGDGLPEIYAVNYLAAPDLLTRICRDSEGSRAPCTPRDFDAATDRLYWNAGDGTWSNVARTAGISLRDGKGLGILATDLDGTGHNDVFVANDGVRNYLFRNTGDDPSAPPRFQECALQMGLAYNEFGRAEACMGILAEDLNNDRRIDLFVTNFYDESNTFYRQQPGPFFQDATRSTGLHDVSFKQLGFGTQAVDADLDGAPELFVANGHVDDYTSTNIPYEMPPQLLQNVGANGEDPVFELVDPETIGAYFSGRYLGRAAARLDWNRDGREDIVVTHLKAPVALLTNCTEPHGHFLRIVLRGTASGRDAIGTQVTLSAGGRRASRQLVAGDGYECTNERSLVFGLGANTNPVQIDVRWSSGRQQSMNGVGVDQSVIIVEGRSGVYPIPPAADRSAAAHQF